MKRLLPIIFAASLTITSCSKNDSPTVNPPTEEEVKSNAIRDKYIRLIPELKDYTDFEEGETKNKKYKTVVAFKDVDFFIAYIDDNGLVFRKKKWTIDSGLKGKVGKIDLYPGDRYYGKDESSVIVLRQKGKDENLIGVEIVYPNGNELSKVGNKFDDVNNSYFGSLAFNNNSISFFSNKKVYIYNKSTTLNTLISDKLPETILSRAYAYLFLENMQFVLVEGNGQGLSITSYRLYNDKWDNTPVWEANIRNKENLNKTNVEISDTDSQIIITLKETKEQYKYLKNTGELVK